MALTTAQLTSLVFRPVADANGAAGSFSYTVNDGNGGSDSQTVALNVTPVNDAPVADADKTVTVAEDSANTILGIAAPTDVDGDSLTITVTGVPNGSIGTVYLSDGTTAVTNGMSLTGAELTGLVFRPVADANGTAGSFSYSVNDGNGGSDSQTVTLSVTSVNDAPVNTVPAAQTMNEDGTLTFSTANGNAISIADVDAGSSSVQVTLAAANGVLGVTGIAGVTVTGNGTGTVVLTGSQANINTVLNGLTFTPTGNYNGAANLTVTTNDQGNTGSGGALSDVDSVAITVNAVNDAPVNTVPAAQTMSEDGTLTFSVANGNAISIADVDAGSSSVQVTLAAANGVLGVTGIAGVTVTGNGTGTVVLTGSQANINTVLNGLTFTPTGNYNGAASLTITTNDQGNTGSGGALSDVDSVAITVNAVNDAPVNTVPAAQTMNDHGPLTFSVANGNAISIADVDAGSSSVQVTLAATNGV